MPLELEGLGGRVRGLGAKVVTLGLEGLMSELKLRELLVGAVVKVLVLALLSLGHITLEYGSVFCELSFI